MPGFVQIMELDTSKIDEVDAQGRALAASLGSEFKARKATTAEDRERRGHYYIIVEFDSYEEAMQNSEDPKTSEYSERLGQLLDGPPAFHNLDVVSVMELG
jgi:quinol monooxygenase YgiN